MKENFTHNTVKKNFTVNSEARSIPIRCHSFRTRLNFGREATAPKQNEARTAMVMVPTKQELADGQKNISQI